MADFLLAKKPKGLESDHPPYIHFTLQKTNREMHDSLSSLSRALRLLPRDLGTAGTKDKRAVTVQRVSIKRGIRTIEEIYKASKTVSGGNRGRGGRGGGRGGGNMARGERGVVLGDFTYEDYGLELGMLTGNKFVITLRFVLFVLRRSQSLMDSYRDVVAESPSQITSSIAALTSKGFINYYGMQRFGTAPIPTHVIGLALLQCNWALAAHLILRKREGENDDLFMGRDIWEKKGLAGVGEAVRAMPRRAVAERASKFDHFNSEMC